MHAQTDILAVYTEQVHRYGLISFSMQTECKFGRRRET
jgi:hypothetical protein